MFKPHVLVGLLLVFAGLASAVGEAGAMPEQIKAMGLTPFTKKPVAPDLSLPDLNGKAISLASLKGKVVLLNFWATWCPPCREEMPTLETLYQAFKDRKNFVMLAVDSSEANGIVSDFLKKSPYHFPVLLDTDGAISYQYSIEAIPTTYLIDADGRILGGVRGAFDWNKKEWVDGLKTLLATLPKT